MGGFDGWVQLAVCERLRFTPPGRTPRLPPDRLPDLPTPRRALAAVTLRGYLCAPWELGHTQVTAARRVGLRRHKEISCNRLGRR